MALWTGSTMGPRAEKAYAVEPVGVAAAAGEKCSRCWNYRETVGDHKDHPEVCSRCYAVVAEAS